MRYGDGSWSNTRHKKFPSWTSMEAAHHPYEWFQFHLSYQNLCVTTEKKKTNKHFIYQAFQNGVYNDIHKQRESGKMKSSHQG